MTKYKLKDLVVRALVGPYEAQRKLLDKLDSINTNHPRPYPHRGGYCTECTRWRADSGCAC